MNKWVILVNEFKNLQNDFTGITFNPLGIFHFFELYLISFILFLIFYLIGDKIYSKFFKIKEGQPIAIFINIALGYIFLGTSTLILGVFSLLTPLFLTTFIVLVLFYSIFPFKNFKENIRKIIFLIKRTQEDFKEFKWLKFAVVIFLLISFFRTVPPDIGADALDYHTSYPRLYIQNQTIMLEPKGNESYITIPQLAEMPYVIMEFIGYRDASRIVHFMFYLLVVMLVCYIGFSNGGLGRYAPLLLITSPLILHISPSAYGDFQSTFCWLLTIFVLTTKKEIDKKRLILSGIFFGGMLASKIWALAFFPVFLIYIFLSQKNRKIGSKIKICTIFFLSSLAVALIWYIRSYLLSGNPFYHNENFLSSNYQQNYMKDIFDNLLNYKFKFQTIYLQDYSPVAILGVIFLILFPLRGLKKINNLSFSLFFFILSFEYLFLPYNFLGGRYVIPFYSLLIFVLSIGLVKFNGLLSPFFKLVLNLVFLSLFIIYFLNTAIMLPYGFGWANRDNYIIRNYPGYYDYNHQFSKWLSEKELIATYGISKYYYANFRYKNVYYFFKGNKGLFAELKNQNIGKLLIQGGDFRWFCNTLKLEDCQKINYKELTSYPSAKQYLYEIEK